jgi:hypothetical protein
MAHSAAAARADSNWWLAARLMTALNLTLQGGIGSALVVWALTRPAGEVVGVRGTWGEFGAVFAYLGGVVVLLGCAAHLVIANNVWAYRRGALRALSGLAAVQAAVQILLLLVVRAFHPVTVALALHAAVLILSALAGWKTHCATRHVAHRPPVDQGRPPATPSGTAVGRAA